MASSKHLGRAKDLVQISSLHILSDRRQLHQMWRGKHKLKASGSLSTRQIAKKRVKEQMVKFRRRVCFRNDYFHYKTLRYRSLSGTHVTGSFIGNRVVESAIALGWRSLSQEARRFYNEEAKLISDEMRDQAEAQQSNDDGEYVGHPPLELLSPRPWGQGDHCNLITAAEVAECEAHFGLNRTHALEHAKQ